MLPFCKETYDFLSACEKLQFKLMDGGTLTVEERAIIEDSAIGLLGKMKALRLSSFVRSQAVEREG